MIAPNCMETGNAAFKSTASFTGHFSAVSYGELNMHLCEERKFWLPRFVYFDPLLYTAFTGNSSSWHQWQQRMPGSNFEMYYL